MKKFRGILVFGISIILLNSCAKPTVVNVVLPGDDELNCEQLENAVAESQKIKREAEYAKEGTGGNVTRLLLFWPAWAQTLHNADVAIMAANDRIYHLFNSWFSSFYSAIITFHFMIKNVRTTINCNDYFDFYLTFF